MELVEFLQEPQISSEVVSTLSELFNIDEFLVEYFHVYILSILFFTTEHRYAC